MMRNRGDLITVALLTGGEAFATECYHNSNQTGLCLEFMMTHCKQQYSDVIRKSERSLSVSFFPPFTFVRTCNFLYFYTKS